MRNHPMELPGNEDANIYTATGARCVRMVLLAGVKEIFGEDVFERKCDEVPFQHQS